MGHSQPDKLTRSERKVLALLQQGRSNKQIAESLGIGVRGAEFHVANVLGKLGLNSRAQVAAYQASESSAMPRAIGSSLPAPLTTFIGREWEMTVLRSLCERSRLVTITGAGGIGKTRLAIEATQRLQHESDGPWLVELAPLTNPGLVANTIAATLGVREAPNHTIEDQLVAALRSRRVLILLDNCEHLLAGVAPLVKRILTSCPAVHVLATSRAALGVEGEALLPLLGLSLSSDSTTTENRRHADAVRLFLDRAELVRPGFEPTSQDSDDIRGVCEFLEGMPLAIELAAARLSGMTPTEIRERIRSGHAVLATSSQAATGRHRSLDLAIDWSFSLLEEEERAVFRRLSVCAGFDMQAAESVSDAPPVERQRVPEILLSLVEKSMVSALAVKSATRYRLLEPVRQYAARRLVEAGEDYETRGRHACHFVAVAERMSPEIVAARPPDLVRTLEVDLDNLRAALTWAVEHDPKLQLRLLSPLLNFYNARSSCDESEAFIARAMPVTDELPRPRLHLLGAKALNSAARGRYDEARTLASAARTIARELASKPDEAWASYILAAAEGAAGSPEKSEAAMEDAVRLAREAGDHWLIARTELGLGESLSQSGNLVHARATLESGLASLRMTEDVWGLVAGLSSLALLDFKEQKDHDANARWQQALTIHRELGLREGLDNILDALGQLAIRRGDFMRGLRLAAAADHFRYATGTVGWPTDFPNLAESIARARAALAKDEAERAWDEGTRMHEEDAIQYALEESSAKASLSVEHR